MFRRLAGPKPAVWGRVQAACASRGPPSPRQSQAPPNTPTPPTPRYRGQPAFPALDGLARPPQRGLQLHCARHGGCQDGAGAELRSGPRPCFRCGLGLGHETLLGHACGPWFVGPARWPFTTRRLTPPHCAALPHHPPAPAPRHPHHITDCVTAAVRRDEEVRPHPRRRGQPLVHDWR